MIHEPLRMQPGKSGQASSAHLSNASSDANYRIISQITNVRHGQIFRSRIGQERSEVHLRLGKVFAREQKSSERNVACQNYCFRPAERVEIGPNELSERSPHR